jgi:hypothetical protein
MPPNTPATTPSGPAAKGSAALKVVGVPTILAMVVVVEGRVDVLGERVVFPELVVETDLQSVDSQCAIRQIQNYTYIEELVDAVRVPVLVPVELVSVAFDEMLVVDTGEPEEAGGEAGPGPDVMVRVPVVEVS